ncbi:F-box protein 24 [Anopheles sinensis]|uniref:F-box protein 24 n=1 Tax=Anopheles sinensis TaxID=74873 RepID=A0A084VVP4_ANOSI|nr:F-box protein 24 [Anopheles sinensis]
MREPEIDVNLFNDNAITKKATCHPESRNDTGPAKGREKSGQPVGMCLKATSPSEGNRFLPLSSSRISFLALRLPFNPALVLLSFRLYAHTKSGKPSSFLAKPPKSPASIVIFIVLRRVASLGKKCSRRRPSARRKSKRTRGRGRITASKKVRKKAIYVTAVNCRERGYTANIPIH